MALSRRVIVLVLLIAAAVVLPPWLGVYYTRFATQIAIYGMAALSVDRAADVVAQAHGRFPRGLAGRT